MKSIAFRLFRDAGCLPCFFAFFIMAADCMAAIGLPIETCECPSTLGSCRLDCIYIDCEICATTNPPECTNTCSTFTERFCIISNGAGTQPITGGDSCTTGCTYGDCTVSSCNDGYYSTGTTCVACPSVFINWTILSGGVHSKNKGLNGRSDCYIAGEFSDTIGNFGIDGTECTY
ncbi:MAG: hypothetical protein LBJ73_00510 [Rickettsiales bacterium]|nr:hypothetical protein [Rickettsiales bacterium]